MKGQMGEIVREQTGTNKNQGRNKMKLYQMIGALVVAAVAILAAPAPATAANISGSATFYPSTPSGTWTKSANAQDPLGSIVFDRLWDNNGTIYSLAGVPVGSSLEE